MIGRLVTGDFAESTMTFEMECDFTLQAGKYFIERHDKILVNLAKNLARSLTDYDYNHLLEFPETAYSELENTLVITHVANAYDIAEGVLLEETVKQIKLLAGQDPIVMATAYQLLSGEENGKKRN